jgi:hypothetical protein
MMDYRDNLNKMKRERQRLEQREEQQQVGTKKMNAYENDIKALGYMDWLCDEGREECVMYILKEKMKLNDLECVQKLYYFKHRKNKKTKEPCWFDFKAPSPNVQFFQLPNFINNITLVQDERSMNDMIQFFLEEDPERIGFDTESNYTDLNACLMQIATMTRVFLCRLHLLEAMTGHANAVYEKHLPNILFRRKKDPKQKEELLADSRIIIGWFFFFLLNTLRIKLLLMLFVIFKRFCFKWRYSKIAYIWTTSPNIRDY